MILLDTCTLLWLATDPSLLSAPATESIRSSGEFVEVSAISAWEIAWKHAKGHLELSMDARSWFQTALEVQQIREMPITAAIALTAADLPRIHNDPADRFIIATALEIGIPIITPDQHIRQYPGIKTLW
ncbi:MAG: type II toxin-antitoxin system VapC family toxin [Chthoniobacterales bacterium]